MRTLPDAGSHDQFVEVRFQYDKDLCATVASPLQWLGLDRAPLLIAEILPCLRRHACHIEHVDWDVELASEGPLTCED